MAHSVVTAIGTPLARVLFPISVSGAGRSATQMPLSIPRIDYATSRAGRGYIADKVTINNIGVHRRVCCLEEVTFRLVGDAWSDTSGNYRFDNLDAGTSYIVVSVDHENKYDPVGKAPLYPTRYSS
jgi:hypothetical protein